VRGPPQRKELNVKLEITHAGTTRVLQVNQSRHNTVDLTITDPITGTATTAELSQVEALSLARILEEQVKDNRRK